MNLDRLAELVDPFELEEGERAPCGRCRAPSSGGYVLDGLAIPLCEDHRSIAGLAELLAELGADLGDGPSPGG